MEKQLEDAESKVKQVPHKIRTTIDYRHFFRVTNISCDLNLQLSKDMERKVKDLETQLNEVSDRWLIKVLLRLLAFQLLSEVLRFSYATTDNESAVIA